MGNDQVPVPVPYDGPLSIARDSVWLTAGDIPHDKDTEVTIEHINLRRDVTWQKGRKSPIVVSAKFVGKQRELRLNATHRAVLANLFGGWTGKACRGKSVYLYVEQDVRRPGTTRTRRGWAHLSGQFPQVLPCRGRHC